ncbi:MAG: 50S ribosomal protein L22 [Proteobacteria bacterium]|nr:50S ribosomal protein L22 [Pseudomonadota bacterium]MBQ9244514.1 50S ribosomal protein L22 [Pseudomonadota bacterium]
MGKPSLKNEHHSANRVSAMSVRLAPRKARIIVDMIRGSRVNDAISILRFTDKRGAVIIEKLIESALHNMSADTDIDSLKVARAWVNEGPTLRRYMPRAQGRATRIRKRTCHIHIELDNVRGAKLSAAEK